MHPRILLYLPESWRPDRSAILVMASIALFACITWTIQARSSAQIQRLHVEAGQNRADLEKRLNAVQGVLDRLGKTVAGDQQPTLAASSGRKAIEDGRWGAGQLFLINAITNDPRNVQHLKTYANAVLGHQRPPDEALDQLTSILQMAACHVAVDDVSTVVNLIDRVDKLKENLRLGEAKSAQPSESTPSDSLEAEWVQLKAGDLTMYKDPVRLTAHLRALENLATTLDEQGGASEERTREIADQIVRWTEIAQAAKNANYVEQCLAKLVDPELERMDTDRAISIVQAAEAVLPSFWGIRAGTLPDELQKQIHQYPCVIKNRVNQVGLKKCAELVKRIDETLKVVDDLGPPPPKLQDRCKVIEKQIKEAQVLAAQLPSSDKILEEQKKIEKRSLVLQNCRNDQYSKYQAEVIRRSQEAFKIYNSFTINPSENNAIIIFHNAGLAEVDQALLTPEVSRLFNDVLGKLMGRLNPEPLVQIEDEMGSAKKLKLEDF